MTTLTGITLRDLGILQEANRCFFHPLGMELRAKPDGKCSIVIVNMAPISPDENAKAEYPKLDMTDADSILANVASIESLLAMNRPGREALFGSVIQQLPQPGKRTAFGRFELGRMAYLVGELELMIEDTYETEPIPGEGKVTHHCQLTDEERKEAKVLIGIVKRGIRAEDVADEGPEILRRLEELYGVGQPGMRYFRGGEREYARLNENREAVQAEIEKYRDKVSETDRFLSGDLGAEQITDLDAVMAELQKRYNNVLADSRGDREREMYAAAMEKLG